MSPTPDSTCDASYEICVQIARRAMSNFYWAFGSLGREKRRAMMALYAFARVSDDIVDSGDTLELRRTRLEGLRSDLELALRSQPTPAFLPAVADTVHRFAIPTHCLYDILDGVAMDLDQTGYATFSELETYCQRVATAVGVACVHIWGFERHELVFPLVHKCGLAFQLTNILRDLKEDAMNDRIYLPLEDLARFHYPIEALRRGVVDDRFQALMQFQVARARCFFQESAELQQYLHSDGKRIFPLLHDTYYRLLKAIERRNGDVFRRRVRLGMTQRLQIAWSQWQRDRGAGKSRYDTRPSF